MTRTIALKSCLRITCSCALVLILAKNMLVAQDAAPDRATSQTTEPSAPTPQISFDVVSIRQSGNPTGPMSHSFPPNGDGMTFTNIPVFMVVLFAYSYNRPGLVKGLPSWTRTDRYDIVAKVAESDLSKYHAMSLAERKLMLQKELKDRFKLQIHRESKNMQVYALSIAESGPKLMEANTAQSPPATNENAKGHSVFFSGPMELTGRSAHMEDLALALSDIGVGRQVVDKTGLTGQYDFKLSFTPESAESRVPIEQDTGGSLHPPRGDRPPSVFAALREQLGLKLESASQPVEYLVVDHIEKPSEN